MLLERMCEHINVIAILLVIYVWSLQVSLYGTWHSHQKGYFKHSRASLGVNHMPIASTTLRKNRLEPTHNGLIGYFVKSKNFSHHEII